MTTPPLDLPALRADVESSLNTDPRFPGGGYGVYLNTTVLALLDRVEELERNWMQECGNYESALNRAESAEAKVARVRQIVDNDGIEVDTRDYGAMLAVNADDISVALEDTALDGGA